MYNLCSSGLCSNLLLRILPLWKHPFSLPSFLHPQPQSTHTYYRIAFHEIWLITTWNEPPPSCFSPHWWKWYLPLTPSHRTSHHILSTRFCHFCAEMLSLLQAIPVSTGILEPLSIKDDCCSILTRKQSSVFLSDYIYLEVK